MSDKWQAIDDFWNSFEIPAYDESSVPDSAVMPYITYRAVVGPFENQILNTASIWYHDSSWVAISKKADEIAKALNQHLIIKINDGYMFLKPGSPFSQRMNDTNPSVRRVYINVDTEFFTQY